MFPITLTFGLGEHHLRRRFLDRDEPAVPAFSGCGLN